MLRRQDIVLLLSTFVVGMVIGCYAYFAGFAPVSRSVATTVGGWRDTVTIVSEVYGGCQRQSHCPSFFIADDGSYRYFHKPAGTATQVLQEGQLPRSLYAPLRRELTLVALQTASQAVSPTVCHSHADGIDVLYRVSLNDIEYKLDSCGTAVDGDGVLWQRLSALWNYFDTLDTPNAAAL